MDFFSRRRFLRRGLIITGLAALARNGVAAVVTPRATEGPFYPTPVMRFNDTDNDLVKVRGKVEEAGGEVIHLHGNIRSKSGQPLVGYRIEIWQCDVNGKYLHSGDDNNIEYDTGFQGFGYDITDADGAYRFKTIKPTPYPGRTPHIHVKVLDGRREKLTTQFYIADEPSNRSDGVFRRMSVTEADSVSMVFVMNEGLLTTNIDLIV
ncbi:dioxygenase family protein [Marinomonas sp. TW1]|uniref:dioxygenase family protein n=1 Tax=Marinomonas sp. TW1 TaxID=1561203 RepID=UPI0007AF92F7|nr:protocatechuate 3,4-dioxygenase [Marinomonas sp. TW1]KZN13593.1 protocatechuate 3,4-dioxygenase [Marinomonas sp. TW1]